MDKSNLLTPTQMAGMATSKPTSPAVPGNPVTPIIPSNGLLTPTQMAQMAQHQDPANPNGAVGSSWDAFDKAKGTSTNGGVINSLKTSLGEAKNEITGTGVNQGENPIQRGVELAATATGAIPKAVTQLPVIKPVVDAINGVSADAINWIADKIGSIKAAQDFVMNHPEAAKNLENVAKTTGALADTTGNLALIQGGINALKKPDVTKAINTVDRHIAEAQDVITENTANPSETFNQLGGEKGLIESVKTNIADGLKAEGHVQAADAVRGLDTTKVNSLNDFSTLAKDTIKEANLSPLAGAVKPFAETAKTGIQNKVVADTVNDWERIGGDYVKTNKLLDQEETRLSNSSSPSSLQDTPTFLANLGITPQSIIENGKFSKAGDVADTLTTSAIKPFEDTLTQQLKVVQQGQPPIPMSEVRTAVINKIKGLNIEEGDRATILNSANRKMTLLENKYPKGIPLDELNVQKGLYWGKTKFDITKPFEPQVNYNIGSVMKNIIETKAGDANVGELNGVLANYYKAGKFLRGLENQVPKLTLGQKITRGVVKGALTAVGEKMFGIGGGVGGFLLGKSTSIILENASNPLRGLILQTLEKTDPIAYKNALEWLGEKEEQKLKMLSLPPPKTIKVGGVEKPYIPNQTKPIIQNAPTIYEKPATEIRQTSTNPKTGTQYVKNPATGKMEIYQKSQLTDIWNKANKK